MRRGESSTDQVGFSDFLICSGSTASLHVAVSQRLHALALDGGQWIVRM